MQFEYTTEQTEVEKMFGGHRHLNAIGKINLGDADRFLKLLKNTDVSPSTTVYINSTGGNAEEGIKLGCVIRSFGLETSIGTYILVPSERDHLIVPRKLKPGKCISAATLMFAGGVLRHFPDGSTFGVHRFSYKDPLPKDIEKSQELSAGIAKYLDQMGISLDFLSLSASVASDSLLELTEGKLRESQMVTGGQTDVEWTTQNRNGGMYVRGERKSIFGHHKVMLCFEPSMKFHFWAVIEAQGRMDELQGFGLVEIVLDGEAKRIDVSKRAIRQPMNGYLNVIVKLEKEEAKLLAHSASFGIQIRFSNEAPMFLGIAAMDTSNGQEQLINFYNLFSNL